MITRKRKAVLMKAVSELKRADYSSEPELGVMYDRLADGRKQFAEVFDKNINAVMQISSLDLTMQHQTKKIVDISEKIANATDTIFGATSGSTNNPQEELKCVARALLPPEIAEGSGLHYEMMEYTLKSM